jgi:hypothetical protein
MTKKYNGVPNMTHKMAHLLITPKKHVLTSIVVVAPSTAWEFCGASALCRFCLIVCEFRVMFFGLFGVVSAQSGVLFFTGDALVVADELFPAV